MAIITLVEITVLPGSPAKTGLTKGDNFIEILHRLYGVALVALPASTVVAAGGILARLRTSLRGSDFLWRMRGNKE